MVFGSDDNINQDPVKLIRSKCEDIEDSNVKAMMCRHIDPSSDHNFGWRPPEMGIVKLNTDRACAGTLGCAAAGGVLRDCRGNWCMGFYHSIGICSPLDAELWGALLGLDMAWNKGYRKIYLEMDSLVSVDLICGRQFICGNSRELLRRIQGLLSKDWEVTCNFVRRECNGCAHLMAQQALKQNANYEFFSRPPNEVLPLVTRELVAVSSITARVT